MNIQELVDLASERVGGRAVAVNDEFFAPKENLTKPSKAIFIPDKYTEFGKWMDGWETRRRRVPGHDWCVIRLGTPGVIRGFNVDTSHFLGNYPEHCSIEACACEGDPIDGASWTEILMKSKLRGGADNLFEIASGERWTHVRLNIHPDGGVARLRVHGEVKPDWKKLARSGDLIDLAAVENGGTVVTCNDMFFGPKDNLIMPGRAVNMGDGWETKRKRVPGHDWIIVRFGAPGSVKRVEVDTNHFKGNYPDMCSIEACALGAGQGLDSAKWEEILPRAKLQPHTRHFYEKELRASGVYTHARLNIYPDGGVSRLRIHGVPDLHA